MGGDPGVGHEAEGCVWFWLHGHQKPGQHLLPRHSDAGPLQHPRLSEDVSTLTRLHFTICFTLFIYRST